VHDGFISITPLRADMTDDAWLTGLADVLSGRRGE